MVEVQKEWVEMIISNNIKKHREAQHFTQEELANRMHISRQSISKWERGDALPSIENLIALSELLDLSLDELILNKEDLPLPLNYGKLKSKRVFLYWMFFPMLLILSGLFSLKDLENAFIPILVGLWLGGMVQAIGMIDLRRMFTYFTVTKSGIEFFSPKIYCPSIIREILALFNKRSTRFILYSEISKMVIYFDNTGFEGHGTTVAYRPRQYFYNREFFELHLYLKNGEVICLNLDRAFFPDSNERMYFCPMFDYFESRGIQIIDNYNVLKSIKKEYSIIEEAYKLKEKQNN
ncbi:hypothetical protein CBF32_05905 [Vagococcus fluvialis]|uniref:HTH cro/C1-type domain-containing protein n=3 Tax=Vagococcus fluvialis TaxID=2738 RepID=A0A430A707_9ENTE|nr:hypothetical protein CBF32_05905 [Vagococcus fluvialis]